MADAPHTPAEGESADVEFLGGGESSDEGEAAGQARGEVDPDADDTGAVDPADDDAEFIDGEGPGGWPEQDGEDEGYDAELDGADAGVSVDGNLSPQVDAEVADGEDVEFIEADADAADAAAGDARRNGTDPDAAGVDDPSTSGADRSAGGSPSRQVELTTSSDRVDTAYVCPDCGNRERVGASSMRAGDICPDCRRGYIEEREIR
ncbi:hypothetical protein BRC97_02345 [Halobacteriales archaeon QS_6_71_20]|nr:MAG: hypothetical protein BRC97_02345 [Halobacteriales archaeon QS_6_71_20]